MNAFENMMYYVRCCQVQEFFHQCQNRNIKSIYLIYIKTSDEKQVYYLPAFYVKLENAKDLFERLFQTIYDVTQHFIFKLDTKNLNYIYKNVLNFTNSVTRIKQRKLINKTEFDSFYDLQYRNYDVLIFDKGYYKVVKILETNLEKPPALLTLQTMRKLIDESNKSENEILEECKQVDANVDKKITEILQFVKDLDKNKPLEINENLFSNILRQNLDNLQMSSKEMDIFIQFIFESNPNILLVKN